MMIALSTNVWTPKVDSDNEVSNLLFSMAEAISALIVLFGIKTEIIFRDKRDWVIKIVKKLIKTLYTDSQGFKSMSIRLGRVTYIALILLLLML